MNNSSSSRDILFNNIQSSKLINKNVQLIKNMIKNYLVKMKHIFRRILENDMMEARREDLEGLFIKKEEKEPRYGGFNACSIIEECAWRGWGTYIGNGN